MAHILPFGGFRYGAALTAGSGLEKLVAPPYDVLSKEEVAEYHARDPHNITHLTRPRSYEAAAQLWEEWRSSGALAQDAACFYLYTQSFTDPETGVFIPARNGLICALHLEEYGTGAVLPHENTIAAHRADRLELMLATHANLEPIFGLYSDAGGKVSALLAAASRFPEAAALRDAQGGGHALRRISEPAMIRELQTALRGRPVLIADGHHRYETALAYRSERPSEPGSGAILISLTAFEDQGLIVLPTHRLVRGVDAEQLDTLAGRLSRTGFDVQELPAGAERLRPGTRGFDLVRPSAATLRVVLRGGPDAAIAAMADAPESEAWKALDVAILHKLVLENLLGIPMASLGATDRVRYTRDEAEARAKVETGEFQAAFVLGRPTVQGVQAVSAAGDRMPQKSTFFYPKLLSGLVMRSLV